MGTDIELECDLAAEEAAQTIKDIEAAVGAVLAALPSHRLVRLGMCCAHPEFLEQHLGRESGEWADVLQPLVAQRLVDIGSDRVVHDLRTRALLSGMTDALR